MREVIAPQLAEVYPQFAAQVFRCGSGLLSHAENLALPVVKPVG
jgi:hypothetical protein